MEGTLPELADYTLEETIYEGSETCVRRARHRSAGEPLVVKQPVSNPPRLRTVGRLLHEHQILGKLAAVPGVVRARALSHQAGSATLWLEDPGLRSLDRVLAERGRLPLAAALRVARALSRVLAGVHAAGVVHKDVKPQCRDLRSSPPAFRPRSVILSNYRGNQLWARGRSEAKPLGWI